MIDFQWADPVVSGRICLTLLHSLWQVALFTVLAGLAVRVLRQTSVERSYQFHLGALLAALVAIPVTYSRVEVPGSQTTGTSANAVVTEINDVVPFEISNLKSEDLKSGNSKPAALPRTTITDTVNSATPLILSEAPSTAAQTANRPTAKAERNRSWQILVPWIATVYIFGVAAMLLRLIISVIKANRLKRECRPVLESRIHETLRTIAARYSMKLMPALMQAERAIVPQVIGLIRPVILLPASALTGLTADELELILTHELAHIRRYDMWAAMLQRLAEAVLFFNPALWFLSRRISELREFCCDDIACRADLKGSDPLLTATRNKNQNGITGSDPFTSTVHVRYAHALLKVVELSCPDPSTHLQLTTLAASGRSPSELRRRMARLLGEPLREPVRISRGGMLVCVSVVAGLLAGPSLIPGQKSEEANAAPTAQDEPAKDETRRTFRLTVNGPDGQPVPHASCEIRGKGSLTAEQILEGTFVKAGSYGTFTAADESGRLILSLPRDVGSLEISIKHPGFGPYWAAWESSRTSNAVPEEATIELDAAWSVGGVIVDAAGAPIEGAEVSPGIEYKKLPGETHQLGVGTNIRTNAKGEWRCDFVPELHENVYVSIDHPKHQPIRMPLPRADYELKLGESPSKQIVLPSGVTIAGRVMDDQGLPVEHALVRTKFRNEIREARTDRDGNYSIGGCEPKMTRIVVSAKGRALEMQELLVDADMQPVDFVLKPGGHVRIRVVDAEGKGLAKSRIFFQQWRGGRLDDNEFDGVSEYTDDSGVWEWNEAPLDEFQADICRPGGFQLSYQPLIAREEEYVFSPPPALVISGMAVDAVTNEPVLSFRAVPGTVDSPGLRGEHWHQEDAFAATDGHYRLQRTRDAPVHRVRFEAVGYKVATSRDIRMDEGTIDLHVKLQPARIIAPVILTPAGKPASAARIALGVKGDQITIKNGEIRESNTYATKLTADADGRFSIPERSERFQLVIMHPEGFARLTPKDGDVPDTITLKAWARAEGIFRIAQQPVSNVEIAIRGQRFNLLGEGDDELRVWVETSGRTNAEGRYVIDRVFPEKSRIGREITYMVKDGATEVTSAKKTPVAYISGETTRVDFGDSGRAVVGKLIAPDGHAEPVFWGDCRLDVETDIPKPPFPQPPADLGDDNNAYNTWFAKWLNTPEGRIWTADYKAAEAELESQPNYHASIDRDGSFRIDDMLPGKYVVKMRFHNGVEGMLPERIFEVPTVVDGDKTADVDLGELRMIAIE